MRTRVCSAALLLLSLCLLPATAAWGAITQLNLPSEFGPSTVLDFDEQPDGTAANTLYLAQGVEFSYDTLGSPVPIIDWVGIGDGRTTTSTPNVLSTEDGVSGSVFSNFLDLIFASTVLEVGAFFGNDQGLSAAAFPVQLEVFDVSDASLGFVTVQTNQNVDVDQFIGVRSDDPIARARITYLNVAGDLSVALDDVIFSAVPEPSTGLLLALGLLGLARRRA